jgi:26S proteasome regulatory subunit T5
MSSAPPPIPPANEPEKQSDQQDEQSPLLPNTEAAMDTTPDVPPEETWEDIPVDVMALSTDEILTRIRLIENDIKVRVEVLYVGDSYYDAGHAIRDTKATARTERHEGKDS